MSINRFVAAFDSECEDCGTSICEGDEAGYIDGDVCCSECCDDAEDEDTDD